MNVEKAFLILHVVAGSTALISGAIAALSRKGGKNHITVGRVFAYSMLVTGISALIMSRLRPNAFLFGIGVFTIYLVVSGWIPVKHIPFSSKLKFIKGVGVFGLVGSAYMLIYAIASANTEIIVLYGVFGSVLLIFSLVDIFRPPAIGGLIRRHGGRMGGAYIAAFTAFLVVNNTFLPPLMAWLLPTAIGSPLIAIALRKWKKKNSAK